ncbi:MAG: hypothetical protein HN846_00390 [Candidatus Pacebacteria bacterium]|jgi:hypothetical protein|nr:hypothetical protein [Candidatus Paceibacterota bacterium]MBT4004449.1 hypothetical protein [Candidatus Paceibacterota bacterium]MBT4358561.1 hypothetical protein [Candidatus Paceibacterota bacterium]MBT4680501.1 hypothetical protein [Candidatus Paceibacterota bacterium]MBT6898838.1 hypothetical protein [Candidatus Paceibacterota bacterium]
MKKIFTNKNLKILLFFILISFSVYWRLFDHFYEQDEWMGVGHIKVLGISRVFEAGFLPAIIGGAGRPIAGLINYFFFTNFTFEAFPFALTSIILHSLTVYALFILLEKFNAKNLFQNTLISLFFLINAVSSQGVMWFSTAISVELSTLLLILSIIFFMDFNSTQNKKKYFLSILTFYLSFLTKEAAVLFSIFFIVYLFLQNKKEFFKKIKYTLPYITVSLIAFLRYLSFFLVGNKVGKFVTSSPQGQSGLLSNAITYPIKSISHFFVSPEDWLGFFSFMKEMLPEQSFTLPSLLWAMSILLIALSLHLFVTNKIDRKIFIYGLVIYLVSILPYSIINSDIFLESRYYYAPLVGVAVILTSFKLKKNYQSLLTTLAVFVLFAFMQISSINQRLEIKVVASQERKKIVDQLKSIELNGNKKNIFLIESDNPDYVVPKQVLPLQQGIGYTLMVLYYDQGVIPNEFLISNYLWDMGNQGLYESDDYLFGFFVEEAELEEELLSIEDPMGINLINVHFNKNYEASYDKKIL